MAWLKTTDGGSYHAIVSGNCGNIMLTMNDNRLLFGSQCSEPIEHDTYGTTELNDGVWHHVAATYDENGGGNNLRVYVDGVLEGQSTKTGQFVTGDFTIASQPAGEYINGNLDMVRIWNAALTQEQIQENMNSSVPSVESDLLADWRFNAGEGDIFTTTLAMQTMAQLTARSGAKMFMCPQCLQFQEEITHLALMGWMIMLI